MGRSQSVAPDYAEVRAALRCANPRCVCQNARGNVHCPAHQDNAPSLTIHEHDGKVLVHCQSGCDQRAVIQALQGLDLWPSGSKSNGSHPRRATHVGPPIATFDYRDAHGQLLYEVVRFPNFPDGRKDFCQRKPAKTGGWVYKIGEVDRVPYRLPELVEAVRHGRTVLIAEGEKDVENLRAIGCNATCNAGGAGKWDASWVVYFTGARVVILPDNDDPGRKHAEDVARSLRDTAASVKVLALPGLLPKGDVTDWLQEGHTLQDLVALAKATPEWAPNREADKETPYHATEAGSADRIIARRGDELRHAYNANCWYVWQGNRWAANAEDRAFSIVEQELRAVYAEAAAIDDKEERNKRIRYALRCESRAYMKAVLDIMRWRSALAVLPSDFDQDPLLFNCLNGTVDLRNGIMRSARREDMIAQMAGTRYDLDAPATLWERFLNRIVPDASVRAFLQRACGYALTGDTSEQCFFFLHGTGSNGKSVFTTLMLEVLGDYGLRTSAELLLAHKDGARTEVHLSTLPGKRFVATIEIDDGRRMAEGLVKQMTGGDRISAKALYKQPFEFEPTHKIWMAANHRPAIRGTDHAIWRRVMLIPFTETIPDEEQDPDLPRKLRAELPGILRWCVEGCIDWRGRCAGGKKGLQPPTAITDATKEYRQEQDTMARFFEDCCHLTDPEGFVRAAALWECYSAWCKETGEKPTTNTAFGRDLSERGYEVERDSQGKIRRGLSLNPHGQELLAPKSGMFR